MCHLGNMDFSGGGGGGGGGGEGGLYVHSVVLVSIVSTTQESVLQFLGEGGGGEEDLQLSLH